MTRTRKVADRQERIIMKWSEKTRFFPGKTSPRCDALLRHRGTRASKHRGKGGAIASSAPGAMLRPEGRSMTRTLSLRYSVTSLLSLRSHDVTQTTAPLAGSPHGTRHHPSAPPCLRASTKCCAMMLATENDPLRFLKRPLFLTVRADPYGLPYRAAMISATASQSAGSAHGTVTTRSNCPR